MFGSGRIIFLLHIGCIRDDIYHSSKKIQPGTNLTSNCFTFGGQKSDNSNIKEMNLKKTELIQFSMFESTINMFQDHVGHIRDDIYHSSQKIQPGTKSWIITVTFWGGIICLPQY